jgi:hypothetical protein
VSKSTVVIKINNIPGIRKAVTGEALARAAQAGGHVIEGYAKINANNVFSSKSTGGAGLGGSIQVVLVESTATSASVDVGPSVIYGRIQEFGGVIKPVHAKMLSWVDDGVRIFAHMVHLPPRPYLRPAVDEHMKDIEQAIGYQLQKQISGAAGE